MFESMLTILIYLLAVLSPALLPAIVHVAHVVRDGRPAYRPGRAARHPLPTASRRLAVPLTA